MQILGGSWVIMVFLHFRCQISPFVVACGNLAQPQASGRTVWSGWGPRLCSQHPLTMTNAYIFYALHVLFLSSFANIYLIR